MRPSTRCALTLAVILFVLLFVPVARPAWAVNLPLGQTQTGSIATAAQSNSYTFTANANDVVTFTATTTSGSLSPKVCLYGTTGTQLSCVEDLLSDPTVAALPSRCPRSCFRQLRPAAPIP